MLTTNAKRDYPECACSIETRKVCTRHQEHEGRCDYACAVPAGVVRSYNRCGLGLAYYRTQSTFAHPQFVKRDVCKPPPDSLYTRSHTGFQPKHAHAYIPHSQQMWLFTSVHASKPVFPVHK